LSPALGSNVQHASQPTNVTPELGRWIADQINAGCHPDALLKAMLNSGWNEATAVHALQASLQGCADPLSSHDGEHQALAMPMLASSAGQNRIQIGVREVEVLAALSDPYVVVLSGLLSNQECEELIQCAQLRLARSETVDLLTGASAVNAARTSEGMFFNRGENELCSTIEARIAALLSWPVENGEGLQILRYGCGAEYRPHHDYFDPAHSGTAHVLRRGGQRVGTVIMYLNTPKQGGSTIFPDIGLSVAPICGHAVFFNYDRPHPSTRTLHGGSPVLEGEKWIATKWLRRSRFE
jgi:prolyl 4-hydroxylase